MSEEFRDLKELNNLKKFKVDLHIHSVLSPCGELEMGPKEIAARAREIGLDAIALTDHNAAANLTGLKKACAGWPVVFFGMEVQSAEDIHTVAIFPNIEDAMSFQEWVWQKLLNIPNDTDKMGYQLIVDENNDIVDQVENLLIQGVRADIDQVLGEIRARGGLSILAHVDRPSFSYPSVLGFLPPDLPVDAVELSWRVSDAERAKWKSRYPNYTFVRASDSHSLEAMIADRASVLLMEKLSFEELKKALHNEDGRAVIEP